MNSLSHPILTDPKLNRELPLLEYTETLVSGLDLSNTLVIAVQHLCSTTYSLFKTLFNFKLDPSNLVVLGKCYSTDPAIYDALISLGVGVHPNSIKFNSHLPYDEQFDASISHLWDYVLEHYDISSYQDVIVLDDGGHLITKTHDLNLKFLNFKSIEQTSSGFNRTLDLPLKFPVINLARAWSKLSIESQIIIRQSLDTVFKVLENYKLIDKKILIMGNGVLGNIIANKLRHHYDVSICDTIRSKSSFHVGELKDRLPAFNLILGCTGVTSIDNTLHHFLQPGTSLASLSSTDREFDSVHFRKARPVSENCHANVSNDNQIYLLNSGFPINFTDEYLKIDPDHFQFTRSLILISIAQASRTSSSITGYIDLDTSLQKAVTSAFKQIVGGNHCRKNTL